MKIDEINYQLKENTKRKIYTFFCKNFSWIQTHDLLDFENIRLFGNMLEEYMDINNLNDNLVFLTFLAEVRYSQYAYKLIDQSLDFQNLKNYANFEYLKKYPNILIIKNKIILKWYEESRINLSEENNLTKQKLVRKKMEPKKK